MAGTSGAGCIGQAHALEYSWIEAGWLQTFDMNGYIFQVQFPRSLLNTFSQYSSYTFFVSYHPKQLCHMIGLIVIYGKISFPPFVSLDGKSR